MKKNYLLLLTAFLCSIVFGYAQYSGTGNFTKITSAAELTDGYYVITNENDDNLMTNGRSGADDTGYFVNANVTPASDVIANPTTNNVWLIETNGSGKTIYNEVITKYVGYYSGNAASIENTPADSNRWTFTYAGGKFTVLNVNTTSRQLSYNAGAPRFAAYGNAGQQELQIYKLAAPTGPNITATPTTITSLDYAFGSGPSASQSFDVTGTLLTAGTTITSTSTDFEVSLTAVGGYGASVNIPLADANSTITVYTRLAAGLAINTYSNTITIANTTSGLGTTPTITVSGEVTPAPPTNDTCLNATVLPVTIGASCTTASYTTINATNSGESTSCGGYAGSADIWFEITVPASGELNIETTAGALTDGVMAIYSGACGTLTQIACDDDTNGSMPELNLTGLTPSETLYLLFWEYNGDNNGDFGICVWSPAPLTPCVAPTGQPSGLTLNNITGSSIDGSFTATTADDYLVVVSASATLGANPVDITSYTTGDTIGSGTVVQTSTATTFTATGLSQTTPYYFFVFALNDSSCGGGPIYNTTAPLTGDATTISGPCLTEDFESGLPTSYETGSWTLGSGTWTGENIIRGNTAHTGAYGCQIRSATGAQITSPTLASVQTVNFWSRGSTTSARVQVNYSTDGGTSWTAAPESPYTLSTSYNQFTATINTSTNTLIQFYRTAATVYLDDVEVFCGTACTTPADPTGTISGATPVCAASTSLSFSGTAPSDVVYYWQDASLGEDVTNAASSSLTVTTSGNYFVRAYNTLEGCWSDGEVGPYAVSVTNAAPTIDSQPSNASAGIGGTASFIVSSTDTSSYQWKVSTNGGTTWTNIGTDSNSLAVTNTQLTDSGNLYQVILTNACGSTTSNTATLTVTTSTIFNPGELIFVGYDGQINGSGSEDEFLIASLVDITTGTEFSLVNSRFEAGAPANVRTNKWGGGSNTASQAPFETKIMYTGSSVIPAGSVLRFNVTASNAFIVFVTVTEGTTTTTRTSDFTFNIVNTSLIPNISTSGADQLYLMQGDFVSDGAIDANEANYIFNGTLLHGITIDTPWVALSSACPGGSTDANRVSRLPAELRCFNVESEYDIRGYYENDKEHGLATIRTIVNNVSDYLGNWSLGSYSFDPTTTTATDGGRTFTISPSNPAGQWVGDVDTNWFNCANWEALTVPTSTTDVVVDASASNNAVIDYTAAYADEVNEIAYANNLTIAGNTLEISGSINNVLEVHGDLLIDTPGGFLDMNDGNSTTADGYIKLYGDWITNLGETAFDEGNSTVEFLGTTPQAIINGQTPIPPIFPEAFYNVILSNDFNTNASNDLYMNGSLLINPGNTLTIATNDYTYVNLGVTNNGTFNIENSGSLIQGDDAGVNTGNISMQRTASLRRLDYVYWSSPVDGFNTNNISTGTPTNRIYTWDTTVTNTNGSQGNWADASGTTMQEGVGYIVRGPSSFGTTAANYTATFNNGVPLNGIKTVPVSRGNDPVGFDTNDDDWNLVGNPYPSAIDAVGFLTLNTNIEGYINVWTHGTLPSSAIPDPYYENFGANYDESDYLTYNSAGASTGPGTFNGSIAAAQSFMVNMVDGAATTETVTFNNSLRDLNLINSAFYRTATPEKNRIWLDLVPEGEPAKRILVGYIQDATMGIDRMFDAVTEIDSAKNFYSVIDNDAYKIQGRALPFVDTDIIPLGIEATTSGNYTLAIFAVDGLFETEGQTVYLKDNALGYTHNLTNAPYSFTLDAGTFNDRFEIVFNDTSLSINENELNDAFTMIEQQDGTVKFSTSNGLQIKNVKVYDVLGRLLYNLNGNSSTETYNLDKLSQAAYLAKVTLSNDVVLTKKAIKRN
ncbi:MAG: T9SS type A sorting domain-containing protein [Oceanihabitans sp.]|nr:T9SS type A sorting domain-containing protein [Oceanihabitans sp.]